MIIAYIRIIKSGNTDTADGDDKMETNKLPSIGSTIRAYGEDYKVEYYEHIVIGNDHKIIAVGMNKKGTRHAVAMRQADAEERALPDGEKEYRNL